MTLASVEQMVGMAPAAAQTAVLPAVRGRSDMPGLRKAAVFLAQLSKEEAGALLRPLLQILLGHEPMFGCARRLSGVALWSPPSRGMFPRSLCSRRSSTGAESCGPFQRPERRTRPENSSTT